MDLWCFRFGDYYIKDSPTQSITNGDRTDNSDEGSSIRGGTTTSAERSLSRAQDRSRERLERDGHVSQHNIEYGVVQTQPRSSRGKRPPPRRHTLGGKMADDQETERSKEAFMDMLASRYPQYVDKPASAATSEDGFPVRGRSRDPRRRATVGYSHHNRTMDYEGTMSEVDGPTFQRGGFVRSSLPGPRSPQSVLEKPPGLVFLIFRDETKKALLPNEITHLDTVRALFVRSFPGKLTMSFLESPKRKIYILDPRTNIYYQLEDLRDIKDRTVLRIHECDSAEPQRVMEKPEVRGRTVHVPPGSQGYYGSTPSSAITSKVHKAQTLPIHMQQPIYMSHDDVTQSPVRTSYERSRSLTPDPSRSSNYAQNPIYGRMGISPERPPPPQDRAGPPDRPPTLRTIPENHQMINGSKNGELFSYMDGLQYNQAPGAPSPIPLGSRSYQRQAMSPPAVPTGPRIEPGRRAFSPPPSLQNYDYIQVVPSSQTPPDAPQGTSLYMAKGVRASTVITPQRATGAPPHPPSTTTPQQSPAALQPYTVPSSAVGPHHSWRERSPVGRHSLTLSTAPYSGPKGQQQRSQSYRVAPTTERDALLTRPRSMTPSPMDIVEPDTTRDRIDKMEHQLASLAAWVQTAVIQSGAPSSTKSTSTNSVTSDTSPCLDSTSSSLTDFGSDGTGGTLSQDMKTNILAIKQQADALRADLHSLRRLQQINKESILETVDDAWKKIREALRSVPGAENLLIRQQRNEVDVMYKIYLEDKAQAEKELQDLEHAVEELRSDVLSRQCRVNMSDVEGMALVLSHVTKALGDLKTRFPKLQERLKFVMAAEMEVIVREEKFLKEEPERLDNCLKKCKKLTGTLFTLKRLASVQEHRPPQVVSLTAQARIPTMEDKKAVLENIQAMIPDHEARLQGIQAAETARLRKKKITTQQEALRFGKSLELASKALKPSSQSPATVSSAGGAATAEIVQASSPSASDTSSVISFAMPMSTSTPKSASQPSTSHSDHASGYPVMSLIQTVSPKGEQGQGHDAGVKGHDGQEHKDYAKGKSGKTVDFKTEPAVLPVTSSETTDQSKKKSGKQSAKYSLSSQKSAARAAFFSSLSSPPTPTTSSVITSGAPTTESPTESVSRVSPGATVSPSRSAPSLVRSSAVTQPSPMMAEPHIPHKPSSLPMAVSVSSVVSSQRFSPASPSNGSQSASSKPRTTFTAIPKPYSPTKSMSSPVTPESPKYRIPPSQMSAEMKKQQIKEPVTKPKKVPPPPPPRKSSRLPGHAVLAVNAATINGQLPKHSDKSSSKEKTESKLPIDVIEPPKQFANLEAKVERKSSIGSLKQFTTPLLESKRDLQQEEKKKLKKSGLATQKISSSNLDSEDPKTKRHEKDIDLSVESDQGEKTKAETTRQIVDGKVTNISAEEKDDQPRRSSTASSGSSSSHDSQHDDVWLKRDEEGDESITVTLISEEMDPSVATSQDISEPTDAESSGTAAAVVTKKVKPPPPERRSSLSSRPKTEIDDEKSDQGSQSSIDRLV